MLSKPAISPPPASARRQTWQAFSLLRRAALPDQHHLGWAVLWLIWLVGLVGLLSQLKGLG